MRTLGLAIDQGAVRAVIGDQRRGQLQLHQAATVPLTEPGPAAVATAAAGFMAEHGRGVQRLVISLPSADCAVKLLQFPATSPENLARLARVEGANQLPLPADEVEVSHAVVDGGDASRPATVAVAACRKQVVRDLTAALQAVELRPDIIDVPALALANVFTARVKQLHRPAAVLHLAEQSRDLLLVDAEGQIRQVRQVTGPADELVSELRRNLQAYAGTFGQTIETMLLCGPMAPEEFGPLQEHFGDGLELADPWQIHGAESAGAAYSTGYAVATGLVLRGGDAALTADLTLSQVSAQAARQRQTGWLGLGLAAVIGVLLLGGFWFYSELNGRRLRLATLETQVERRETELAAMGGEAPELVEALRAHAERVQRETDWLGLLDQFSRQLPGGIGLEELSMESGRPVVLRGEAFTNAVIAQTIASLDNLGRFEQVRLDYANARTIGDERFYSFQITCEQAAPAATTREARR